MSIEFNDPGPNISWQEKKKEFIKLDLDGKRKFINLKLRRRFYKSLNISVILEKLKRSLTSTVRSLENL